MAADVQIGTGTAPTVSPDTVDSSNPSDVWFQWEMTNKGDEDGSSVNYYVTLDSTDGTNYFSEFVPDETIPTSNTIGQGMNINAGITGTLPAGEYWASLRDNSGSTLGAALLTVTSAGGAQIQFENPNLSATSVSVADPVDVFFQYDLANLSMQDATSTGYYMTVELNGSIVTSDYAPDVTLPGGQTTGQGIKIEGSDISSWAPGDYWVNLRNPDGDIMGGAALTVTQ
jgi:hypothetical protein